MLAQCPLQPLLPRPYITRIYQAISIIAAAHKSTYTTTTRGPEVVEVAVRDLTYKTKLLVPTKMHGPPRPTHHNAELKNARKIISGVELKIPDHSLRRETKMQMGETSGDPLLKYLCEYAPPKLM